MFSPDPDPLLASITQTIVDRFAPERIVLFGSRARGDNYPDSDYDVIVVLETPLARGERDKPIREALGKVKWGVDIIVYTPAEFDRARDDVGALAHAGEVEGRLLYDRVPSRWPRRVRETPRGVPDSLADWIARAESDFASMSTLAASGSARDGIAFHAHQSTEKFLKAVLISNHVRPPRTHQLLDLLGGCPRELRDDPKVAQACAVLEKLWPKMRYPAEPMPTDGEAEAAIGAARDVRDAVQRQLSIG